MNLGKIALGPMSEDIVEACFEYSSTENQPLMLIASKNQVDFNSGYAFKNTYEYKKFIDLQKNKFPNAKIYLCRDHCGLGFKIDDDFDSLKQTIKTDIENNFDLLHIDTCNHKDQKLNDALYLMDYALNLNPKINFEVGTDENSGVAEDNFDKITENLKIICNLVKPIFCVINTGSLVKENQQVGSFDYETISLHKKNIDRFDVGIKEHNADYLDDKQINLRKNLISAMNIAPQLGYIQTKTVIDCALEYDISIYDWTEEVYESKKWAKWMIANSAINKNKLLLIAGHYSFEKDSYKKIIDQLSSKTDVKYLIKQNIKDLIKKYDRNL